MTEGPQTSSVTIPEAHDDAAIVQTEAWMSPNAGEEGELSAKEPGDDSSTNPRVSTSMQKRRRVTRACDECRRKKIKCDGKQPCTHCTVYNYECTFDQPSNRRRNPAPEYVEALEQRLHRAEALLKTVLPDYVLDEPNIGRDGKPRAATQDGPTSARTTRSDDEETPPTIDPEADTKLESMVEATGQLDIDDQGKWDFHGHSSGHSFLRRMRAQFGDLLGPAGNAGPFIKSRPKVTIFDSPRSASDSPMADANKTTHDDVFISAELPSKETARELISNTLDDACALMRFLHQPSFYRLFERIYTLPRDRYTEEDNRFLPLLYVVLAVGTLFAKTEQSELEQGGYENAIEQGIVYFRSARYTMDITDCRDILSLQTLLFMIIFLQSSAKLSTCYTYVGIALRSALRMGMHRRHNRSSPPLSPIDHEVRKRLFWMIRKMDTYVGAQLGLPQLLYEEDIDQEEPLEVDDSCITSTGILPMPPDTISLITAANAHTRLVRVLSKVIKYIYPIKGMKAHSSAVNASSSSPSTPLPIVPDTSATTYVVPQTHIRSIERDLQNWMDTLPMALRTGGPTTPELARVQQLLRLSYAHTQMMLYRPFLHYVSASASSPPSSRSYACAAACVSVSRNIVHITTEMKRRGMLNGAYWFIMYTNFFAILSLVFFVLENPENPGSVGILEDAKEGRETLRQLSKKSMAADRCTVTLGSLFDQLPEKLKKREKAQQQQGGRRGGAGPTGTAGVLVGGSRKRSVDGEERKQRVPGPGPISLNSAPDLTNWTSSSDSFTFKNQPPTRATQRANTASGAATKIGMTDSDRRSAPSVNDSSLPFYGRIGNMSSETVPLLSTTTSIATPPTSSIEPRLEDFPNLAFDPNPTFPTADADAAMIPDLNALMFPSADPFAYGLQPITTLENQRSPYPQQDHMLPGESKIGGPNGELDMAQSAVFDIGTNGGYNQSAGGSFGPMTPFLLHQQAQQNQLQQRSQLDIDGPVLEQMISDGAEQMMYASYPPRNGSGTVGGINFEDIFGSGMAGSWAGGGGPWVGENVREP